MAIPSFARLNNKNVLALAGNVFMALISFSITALLTRSLSIDGYGTWVYFSMICAIGDAARNGLLITATVKFYAGASNERAQEVLGSIWFIAMVTTAVLALIDALFLPFTHVISSGMLVVAIRWFWVTFISSLPFSIIFGILVAEERYDRIFLLRLVNSGSMIIYAIVLMLLHRMTLEAFLWCNLLTNCLTSAVGLLTGLGHIGTFFRRSWSCIREIFHFGKFTMSTTFVSRLLGSADTNIIPFLLGPSALAVYGIAQALMGAIEILLRTFVGTGLSGMAIAYNSGDKNEVALIFKKYTGMLTITFIPLTLLALIFADVAIDLLGGHKYMATEAAGLFRMFIVIALLYPLDRFIGSTLDVMHKPKINLYKVFIMLGFTVVFDLAGVFIFKDLYGIAMATFLATLAGVVYGYIHLRRYLPFTITGILRLGYAEVRSLVNEKLLQSRAR